MFVIFVINEGMRFGFGDFNLYFIEDMEYTQNTNDDGFYGDILLHCENGELKFFCNIHNFYEEIVKLKFELSNTTKYNLRGYYLNSGIVYEILDDNGNVFKKFTYNEFGMFIEMVRIVSDRWL